MYRDVYPYPRITSLDQFQQKYKFGFLCYNNHNILIGFICFDIIPSGYKLNLSGTQRNDMSTQLVSNKRAKLLVTPGYYAEASQAISWILRSKYHIKPLMDEIQIKELFPDHQIIMNPSWTDSQGVEVYKRSDSEKTLDESLFGIPCKKFYKSVYKMTSRQGSCTIE